MGGMAEINITTAQRMQEGIMSEWKKKKKKKKKKTHPESCRQNLFWEPGAPSLRWTAIPQIPQLFV